MNQFDSKNSNVEEVDHENEMVDDENDISEKTIMSQINFWYRQFISSPKHRWPEDVEEELDGDEEPDVEEAAPDGEEASPEF